MVCLADTGKLTEKLEQGITTTTAMNRAGERSQQKIDALDERTKQILDAYRRSSERLEQLEINNDHMEKMLARQQAQVETLNQQLRSVAGTEKSLIPMMMDMINALETFIEQRKTDRLGLILFGSQAYLQTPLTFDHQTLQQLLKEAQIGIAGPRTAIGDAIGLALKRLKDRPSDSKVLILLTDGANTAGEISPVQAAELAAQKGLRIYTVGVGADEMVLPGIFGSRFGRRAINPSADLDETTLKEIAEITGGQYFRAKNTDELRRIYELLDELEPAEADPEVFRPINSLFYWPLGLVFVISGLLALKAVIQDVWGRRAYKKHSPAVSEGQ